MGIDGALHVQGYFVQDEGEPLLIGRGQLGVDEPLISSGIIDSFGILELMAFLEDTFSVTIDPGRHEMTQFETVNQIAALVDHIRASEGAR